MKTQTLSIDLLRTDGDTQNRIAINEETVEDYAELISEADGEWPLGPLDVFHDGSEYFVADGFHRTMAAERAKRASIPCRVRRGTAKDARIFGMTANDVHGLRFSRADKRACVEWLLDNGGKLTQTEIASKAGVSLRLVKYIVAERKPKKVQIAPFESEDRKDSSDKGKPGGESATPEEVSSPVEDDPVSSQPAAETGEEEVGKDSQELAAGTSGNDTEGPADSDGEFRMQRSKTVKTVEALQRAFDDLHRIRPRLDDHDWAETQCKALLQSARNW